METTVKGNKFASLIVDGATDSSIQEQDIVFVRTCHAGQIQVKFLAIVQTPKLDAESVTHSSNKGVEKGLYEDGGVQQEVCGDCH